MNSLKLNKTKIIQQKAGKGGRTTKGGEMKGPRQTPTTVYEVAQGGRRLSTA